MEVKNYGSTGSGNDRNRVRKKSSQPDRERHGRVGVLDSTFNYARTGTAKYVPGKRRTHDVPSKMSVRKRRVGRLQ